MHTQCLQKLIVILSLRSNRAALFRVLCLAMAAAVMNRCTLGGAFVWEKLTLRLVWK